MCGEHKSLCLSISVTRGSSPRVRGTRKIGVFACCRLGIIPACAGNTSQCRSAYAMAWDHPRVCGEHRIDTMSLAREKGSSPRVRGTRSPAHPAVHRPGIIPACAGNTPSMVLVEVAAWDHPRVCGEHTITCLPTCTPLGSSPRVRGTPDKPADILRGLLDHPRVCGEH